jgi:hypothetical protein
MIDHIVELVEAESAELRAGTPERVAAE